ncbi:tetratricopeptide repeat protein [Ancylomarina longa]|uniref:Uncharacterized protein n=1 Tax=Ancylomarina longa TaxID=2487017 RepID=A0A434B034_9BACT|nr:tetratricopeptide repeat protein [Ancylomarina longa]RUT80077.1 hypothetical protein DLK05_01590 [Ancylomarina longa]
MKHIIILLILSFLSCFSFAQNVDRYMKYHDKGRMLILEGKYDQAIHYLDTAIQIMPYYPSIFQDRGYAYMQVKNYQKAILDFNHVLDKKPYLTEVLLQRGMAYYHLNQLEQAENDLQEFVHSTPVKSLEAMHYLDNIQHEKALAQAQESARIDQLHYQIENERIRRARHREDVIWNTVVPLAFWTTLFLTW